MTLVEHFLRGFHRRYDPPRVIDPGPVLEPDEHGWIHLHVGADGITPAFQVEAGREFRGIVVHGTVPMLPEPW